MTKQMDHLQLWGTTKPSLRTSPPDKAARKNEVERESQPCPLPTSLTPFPYRNETIQLAAQLRDRDARIPSSPILQPVAAPPSKWYDQFSPQVDMNEEYR